MASNRAKKLATLLVVPVLAIGCEVGPDYHAPTIPVPQKFNLAETRPSTPLSTPLSTRPIDIRLAAIPTPAQLQRWWETFHDPELNRLIERALRSNLSLQTAVQSIRQARAQLGVARAGLFPTVNAVGQYNRSHSSAHLGSGSSSSSNTGTSGTGVTTTTTGGGGGGGGVDSSFYQAGFDASWELDVFGGIKRGVEAASANVDVEIENRRSVLITLLGDVATDYVQLRGLQRQYAITRQNADAQQQTLNLIQTQNRAGLVADLAVAQQLALVDTTESQLPDIAAQIHQTIHALSVLLGQEPSSLESELEPLEPIPVGPVHVPPGLPSELLRRRPDIRMAERQLAAANAEVGVATAQLFPQFSLTGDLGFESSKLSQLFNVNSRYMGIGPSVSWPVLEFGAIRYNIEVQNALTREAFFNYESVVLTGFEDVEDALVIYAKEQDRRAELEQAVLANEKAVNLTESLYKNGLDTFLDVLTSQQNLFTAQETLVQSQQAVSTDLVALYKALGGGWEVSPD